MQREEAAQSHALGEKPLKWLYLRAASFQPPYGPNSSRAYAPWALRGSLAPSAKGGGNAT